MLSADFVNTFLFGIYPYVCLAVLLIGSLIRFDREPYTWKSDSSQLLRAGQLRLGSNLFHYGVLVVIFGHFAGFLAPDWAVDWALSPTGHQLLAMVVGGIAGLIAIIGLSILIHRRLADPRIRLNSRKWDIAVVLMLWLQLALGLATVPLSAFHMDGVLFGMLVAYVKGIVTFNGSTVALMTGVPWVYKLHILLGFTIFLISPFTRMIHIWSGVGALAYLFRPYQIVRTPRTRAKVPVRS
jgi:nitrate reductase gamma subunit